MDLSDKELSFEYFPPKTDAGRAKLLEQTTPALGSLGPTYFSVTYGAGGSTRAGTLGTVEALHAAGIDVAPHLSFGLDDEDAVTALLDRYRELGIRRLVALRGDLPSGTGAGARLIYASELVAFVRRHSGDHFRIEVAAYPEVHPQAQSYDHDIAYLKGKFDAGADSAITQYFFNGDAYLHFVEECARIGVSQPIYPGIMPITNFANLQRFSRNCGAEIPRWIAHRVESYGDDQDSIRAFGVEVVTRLCEDLLAGGAPGIHFYSLNQAEPTAEICRNLGFAA